MIFSDIRYYVENKLGRYLNLTTIIYFLSFLAALSLSIASYIYYNSNYNKQATHLFAQSLIEYQKAAQSNSKEDFSNSYQAFNQAYKSYPKSSVAPYVLAYAAESALRAGDFNNALELMEKSVSLINQNSPVYYLYSIKLALMQIDSSNSDVSNKGVESLDKLAKNFSNPYKDMAVYYLGYKFWVSGDLAKAKSIWNLISQDSQESIWASLAASKLELLS